jgi:hypothetical protein
MNFFVVQRTVLHQVDTLWDCLIIQALTPEEMETTFQWFEKEISLGRNEGNTVRFHLNDCAHSFHFEKFYQKNNYDCGWCFLILLFSSSHFLRMYFIISLWTKC